MAETQPAAGTIMNFMSREDEDQQRTEAPYYNRRHDQPQWRDKSKDCVWEQDDGGL